MMRDTERQRYRDRQRQRPRGRDVQLHALYKGGICQEFLKQNTACRGSREDNVGFARCLYPFFPVTLTIRHFFFHPSFSVPVTISAPRDCSYHSPCPYLPSSPLCLAGSSSAVGAVARSDQGGEGCSEAIVFLCRRGVV